MSTETDTQYMYLELFQNVYTRVYSRVKISWNRFPETCCTITGENLAVQQFLILLGRAYQ